MPPGGEWEKGKEAKWGKAEKRPNKRQRARNECQRWVNVWWSVAVWVKN